MEWEKQTLCLSRSTLENVKKQNIDFRIRFCSFYSSLFC